MHHETETAVIEPVNHRDRIVHVLPQLLQKIFAATVPVYCSEDTGRFRFNRSGVLLQIGQHHFLLTAIHGLHALEASRARVFLQGNRGGDDEIEITGIRVVGYDQRVDIGAARLSSDVVRRLGESRHSITLSDIDLDASPEPSTPYILSGFPAVLEGRVASPKGPLACPQSFSLLTPSFDGPLEGQTNKFVHVAVHFGEEFVPADNASLLSDSPHPCGMSGCGMWRVGLSNDATYRAVLAAIQHRYNANHRYALGTRVGVILYAIWKQIPILQPIINEALPHTFPVNV